MLCVAGYRLKPLSCLNNPISLVVVCSLTTSIGTYGVMPKYHIKAQQKVILGLSSMPASPMERYSLLASLMRDCLSAFDIVILPSVMLCGCSTIWRKQSAIAPLKGPEAITSRVHSASPSRPLPSITAEKKSDGNGYCTYAFKAASVVIEISLW